MKSKRCSLASSRCLPIPEPQKIAPRFLLNDLVRYWRTIGIDYADKFHDQAGRKAVLRNVKLRFSRKLIYAVGLDTCLVWYRRQPPAEAGGTLALFRKLVDSCPLELAAAACLRDEAPKPLVDGLFGSYDRFIGVLRNAEQRKELETLLPGEALQNPTFSTLREASHEFQKSLSELFALKSSSELLTYGIF